MSLLRDISAVMRTVTPLVALWLFLWSPVVPAAGQVNQGPPQVPPLGMPGGQVPSAPAPAVIDTAVAVFDIPIEFSSSVTAHTVQDSVRFGDLFHLVLDYIPLPERDLEINLAPGADWLAAVPENKPGLVSRVLGKSVGPQPDTSGLPDIGDQARVVHTFRVYRTNPFRLQVGSFLSPVIHVHGGVEGTDQTAAIRGPRSVGWSPLVVLILLVVLTLILLAARWLWNRGSPRAEIADRSLPVPAWLAATIELRDLLQGGFLQRGDNRAFLDGLAGISRRFVAARYRIAAQDMTGREIITACANLGHRSTQPGVFARMIDALDRRRYDPEGSAVAWSREQAVLFFDQLSEVRIMPRFTEVSGQLRREGDLAWAGLERELSSGPSRLKNAREVIPEPKT